MQQIFILGRQPALGLVELESRYGADSLTLLQPDIVRVSNDTDIFDQLGGAQKAGQYLTTLETTDWNKIIRQLGSVLKELLIDIPEGKVTLGISSYGLRTNTQRLNASALELKKVIKKSGRSARIVPNKEVELNTAQVLHNKLATDNGIELLLIESTGRTVVARTTHVQDIESYRRRDQERPMRDSRVGMLPPKLAQIIINLAGGNDEHTILDPFCGTGVLLQEAVLAGHQAQGSDLEPRMVEYSEKNLQWLSEKTRQPITVPLKVADATSAQWKEPFTTIACETYLGRPFAHEPDQQTLSKTINDCNQIHKKFLSNVARQTEPGFTMCIAVPAWHVKNNVYNLPVLDHLEEMGYNRISFVHAETKDLVYHRDNQVVGRELVVLSRISGKE